MAGIGNVQDLFQLASQQKIDKFHDCAKASQLVGKLKQIQKSWAEELSKSMRQAKNANDFDRCIVINDAQKKVSNFMESTESICGKLQKLNSLHANLVKAKGNNSFGLCIKILSEIEAIASEVKWEDLKIQVTSGQDAMGKLAQRSIGCSAPSEPSPVSVPAVEKTRGSRGLPVQPQSENPPVPLESSVVVRKKAHALELLDWAQISSWTQCRQRQWAIYKKCSEQNRSKTISERRDEVKCLAFLAKKAKESSEKLNDAKKRLAEAEADDETMDFDVCEELLQRTQEFKKGIEADQIKLTTYLTLGKEFDRQRKERHFKIAKNLRKQQLAVLLGHDDALAQDNVVAGITSRGDNSTVIALGTDAAVTTGGNSPVVLLGTDKAGTGATKLATQSPSDIGTRFSAQKNHEDLSRTGVTGASDSTSTVPEAKKNDARVMAPTPALKLDASEELKFECPICTDDYPLDEQVALKDCGHKACRECMAEYLMTTLKAWQANAGDTLEHKIRMHPKTMLLAVACFEPDCAQLCSALPDDYKQWLGKSDFDRFYDTAALKFRLLSDPKKVACQARGRLRNGDQCENVFEAQPDCWNRLTCGGCSLDFCRVCQSPWPQCKCQRVQILDTDWHDLGAFLPPEKLLPPLALLPVQQNNECAVKDCVLKSYSRCRACGRFVCHECGSFSVVDLSPQLEEVETDTIYSGYKLARSGAREHRLASVCGECIEVFMTMISDTVPNNVANARQHWILGLAERLKANFNNSHRQNLNALENEFEPRIQKAMQDAEEAITAHNNISVDFEEDSDGPGLAPPLVTASSLEEDLELIRKMEDVQKKAHMEQERAFQKVLEMSANFERERQEQVEWLNGGGATKVSVTKEDESGPDDALFDILELSLAEARQEATITYDSLKMALLPLLAGDILLEPISHNNIRNDTELQPFQRDRIAEIKAIVEDYNLELQTALAEQRHEYEERLAKAEGRAHNAQTVLNEQKQRLQDERQRLKLQRQRQRRQFEAAEDARRKKLKDQEKLGDDYVLRTTRPCGHCGRATHKTEGCLHITCFCGKHWCWQCGAAFPSGRAVYDHQDTCPRSLETH